MDYPEVGDIIIMFERKQSLLVTKKLNEYVYEMLCLDLGYTRDMHRCVLRDYPWEKVA